MEKEKNRKHIIKKAAVIFLVAVDIFFKYNYELFITGVCNRTGYNGNGVE